MRLTGSSIVILDNYIPTFMREERRGEANNYSDSLSHNNVQ